MEFGKTLKIIRKNRQMTQKEVCKGIMPQGTYSRIEQGKLPLSLEHMVNIAKNLNFSLNEFMYIHQNYHATEREKILKDFREIELAGFEELNKKWTRLKRVEEKDAHLNLLNQTYELFRLISTEDFLQVQAAAQPIWKQLEKLDHWYLEDLELLNSILYYFPIDVAEQIVQTALKRLNNYMDYERNIEPLAMYFQLNLANRYIGEQLYDKALKLLTALLNEKQKMSHKVLSMSYALIVITRMCVNQPYEQQYNHLMQLLEIYEEKDLKDLYRAQIDAYRQHLNSQMSPYT